MMKLKGARRADALAVPVPFWARVAGALSARLFPAGRTRRDPRGIPLRAYACAVAVVACSWAGSAQGGISTWVPSFTLWDAAQDLQVDTSWGDGSIISNAVSKCAAIEIIPPGNEPLPGSVQIRLDGVGQGCGNGTPFDNTFPYGFDTDGGGTNEYSCSSALSAVGTHTLSVTPYAGKSCSGPRGPTTTVRFAVEAPAAPEPPSVPAWINGASRRIACSMADGSVPAAPMSVEVEVFPGGWELLRVLHREMTPSHTEVLQLGLPTVGSGFFPTRCLHGTVPGESTPFYFHRPC